MREDTIVEVAAGIHLVHGSNTNWVILTEGDAVTLIDTGYPGDRPDVLASLDALGHSPRPSAPYSSPTRTTTISGRPST